MSFQIHGLPKAEFVELFDLTDEQLAARHGQRLTVDEFPGVPCRVSLADVKAGESVVLINYQHQDQDTPYRASHAIYVSESASPARLAPGEIPDVLTRRLLSVRAFSASGEMNDADVVEGAALEPLINRLFEDSSTDYLHVHFAKRGCFGAKVTRG